MANSIGFSHFCSLHSCWLPVGSNSFATFRESQLAALGGDRTLCSLHPPWLLAADQLFCHQKLKSMEGGHLSFAFCLQVCSIASQLPSSDRSFCFLSKKRTFRGSKIAILHKKSSNKKIKVNSTCPIMISLTSLFLITLINPLKKIKNATQSCLTDHGQVAEQERSCHSFVCMAMSGRELASISMSHTHNCGNSSPLFCQKCYPICETIIFKPLWVTFFVNFSLSWLQVSKS